MAPISKRDARRLPTRQWAHPYDRKVDGPTNERGVDSSPDAIGGHFGIGWTEYFQCHRTQQIYAVHCSDGVNRGKMAYSPRDYNWMSEMRRRIIARTQSQPRGPIVLSWREWALMIHSQFAGWLDALPRESENDPILTVGDKNRHMVEGQIGTINDVPVIVDRKAKDTLPQVGSLEGAGVEELFSRTRVPKSADKRPTATQFGGVFAAAFQKAGIGT